MPCTGVTHASLENWEYMEIIRRAADVKCSGNLQLSVNIIDSMLSNRLTRTPLKALFGLAGLELDEDFASLIEVSSIRLMWGLVERRLIRCNRALLGIGRRGTGTRKSGARAGTSSVLL